MISMFFVSFVLNKVTFWVFLWLFCRIFNFVSYLLKNFWWSLGTCSFKWSCRFMNQTFCIDKRYHVYGLSEVIDSLKLFNDGLFQRGFSVLKIRFQWINERNLYSLCNRSFIFLEFLIFNRREAILCFLDKGKCFGPYWYFCS